MINQDKISAILDKGGIQSIINSEEFYFQKAQDKLKEWLGLDLSQELANDLDRLRENYELFKNEADNNPDLGRIFELLLQIISYCDEKAFRKNELNEYPDKRILARAFVRMHFWVSHLILLKIRPEELPNGSTKNAFNYLLKPQENSTMLSLNHRKMLCRNLLGKDLENDQFIEGLKSIFSEYDLKTQNPDNFTFLLTSILYDSQLRDNWIEDGNYYIIGSKYGEGNDEDIFPQMLEERVISTGFAWEYDLSDFLGKKQSEIVDYLKGLGQPANSYNCLKRFLNIKPGDHIAVKSSGSPKGSKAFLSIVGIAEVQDIPDYYRHNDHLGHTLAVDWIEAPIYKEFEMGYGKTLHKLTNEDHIDQIFKSEYNEPLSQVTSGETRRNQNMKIPLNQILYGPPGTGKTYHTINHALEIIKGSEHLKNKTRKQLKDEFDILVNSDQIVFTTFHQSMSYEDFIEGLKPKENDGKLEYEVKPGLFKRLCKVANDNYQLTKLKPNQIKQSKAPFDRAFEYLKEQVEQANIENEPVLEENQYKKGLVLELPSSFFSIPAIKGDSIKMMTRTGNQQNTMTRQTLEKIYNNPEDLKNIITGGMNTYYNALVSFMVQAKDIIAEKAEKVELNNYVLIIDEINRGNVSQIFGELITLIEDDKRYGQGEAINVTLPYSGDPFSVPPNLYIIGTMNTADRSVEALDVALRRRFIFEHMPPDPSLLSPGRMLWELYWNYKDDEWKGSAYEKVEQSYYELLRGITEPRKAGESNLNAEKLVQLDKDKDKIWGSWSNEKRESQFNDFEKYGLIGLDELLGVINSRITHLLDEDHQIGHSYFMSVHSLQDLATSFNKNIIPLLKEYFYNDYGKIRMILGDEFVKRVDVQPKMAVSDSDDFISTVTYQFQEVTKDNIGQLINAALGG